VSQIRQIYSNLAALPISFTTEAGSAISLPAADLHQLPDAVPDANAPVRLLLPFSATTYGRDGQFASLDTIGQITWNICDLMLWKRGQLGGGISETAADLLRYQAAYVEALRHFRAMGTIGSVEMLGWQLTPDLYDYPIGSNTLWQGVMVSITVLEELSS